MRIVTDSKNANEPKDPDSCNIFALHKLFLDKDNLNKIRDRYVKGDISYKESKELLYEEIINLVRPMRERRLYYEQNIDLVKKIIKDGGEKAKKIAIQKMEEVREKIGVKI